MVKISVGKHMTEREREGSCRSSEQLYSPQHKRAVDNSSVVERVKVKVDVGVEALALERGLDGASLLAGLGSDVGVHEDFRALHQLVLEGDLSEDGVVRGPLLLQSAAPVLEEVLSLEGGVHTTGVVDGGAGNGKLHIARRFGLQVELDSANV